MEYTRQAPQRIVVHKWKLSIEEVHNAVIKHMKELGADKEVLSNLDRAFLHVVPNSESADENAYYVFSGETKEV